MPVIPPDQWQEMYHQLLLEHRKLQARCELLEEQLLDLHEGLMAEELLALIPDDQVVSWVSLARH